MWNVDRCYDGRRCEARGCCLYHSEAERRCPRFARTGFCDASSHGRCQDGLHVWPQSVREILMVDLESPAGAAAALRRQLSRPVEERAQVVRLVAYGYAQVRAPLL